MEQTIINLPMDATTLRHGVAAVLRHLCTTPPSGEDFTIDYCIGVNVLFDVMDRTSHDDIRHDVSLKTV